MSPFDVSSKEELSVFRSWTENGKLLSTLLEVLMQISQSKSLFVQEHDGIQIQKSKHWFDGASVCQKRLRILAET